MSGLNMTLTIVAIVAVSFSIIAIFYIIAAFRRRTITMKKVDYLIEDITHKAETLNSTVETIAKMANYIDAFEAISKKNIKSAAKLVARNKDDLYKIANRVKEMAMGKQEVEKSKKKGGK